MRVAIVADWIYGGGAEKVVEQLHKLYPDAPIYTSYCSDNWRKKLDNKVITGYLQHPPFRQLRRVLPPLRQLWFSRLDLSGFDLVISSSGNGESKFVRVPNGVHVSYCHTPVHFYWRHYDSYLKNPGIKPKWLARLGLKLLVKPLRKRDFAAAQRVNYFIANSTHIQNDIKKYYGRDSVVIYPPVDTERFTEFSGSAPRKGFVTMGRQVAAKRTELLVQACNELNVPLTVIGNGPEHNNLVKITGPTVTFKTDVTDEQMPAELAGAQAFLFASFEDFGIAPIEALAAGTPVIAYKAGGALDYVTPGKTGEFFDEQSTKSIVQAIKKFNPNTYDSTSIKKSVEIYSIDNFREKIQRFINSLTK